jgi:hypothetical protein
LEKHLSVQITQSDPYLFEKTRYSLVEEPSWLNIDDTGLLRGTPSTEGNVDIVIKVTLEKSVRRLTPVSLSWGQEVVTEVVTEQVASSIQKFRLVVGR